LKKASRVPIRGNAGFSIDPSLYLAAISEVMTNGDFRIRRGAIGAVLESFSGGLDFTIEIVRMA
jgi:hypothetical protein